MERNGNTQCIGGPRFAVLRSDDATSVAIECRSADKLGLDSPAQETCVAEMGFSANSEPISHGAEDLPVGNATRHLFARYGCRPDSDGYVPSNPQRPSGQILSEEVTTPVARNRVSGTLEHDFQDLPKSEGFRPVLTMELGISAPRIRVYADSMHPKVEATPWNEPAPGLFVVGNRPPYWALTCYLMIWGICLRCRRQPSCRLVMRNTIRFPLIKTVGMGTWGRNNLRLVGW